MASPRWPSPTSTTCLAPSSSTRQARGKGVNPFWGPRFCWKAGAATRLSRMVLLVQNKQGYLNLSELLARAWTQNAVKNQAVCSWAWLQELSRA
jgi:DNA polymerase-3 subunit alpha